MVDSPLSLAADMAAILIVKMINNRKIVNFLEISTPPHHYSIF